MFKEPVPETTQNLPTRAYFPYLPYLSVRHFVLLFQYQKDREISAVTPGSYSSALNELLI